MGSRMMMGEGWHARCGMAGVCGRGKLPLPHDRASPSVLGARRSVREPLRMMLAGERRTMDPGDVPKYSVTYELESADVLLSDAWAAAGERGRWPTEVRPHTNNRRHILRKILT